jgi:hypothetical protein
VIKREVEIWIEVQDWDQWAKKEFPWVRVQEDCITSGSKPYDLEDQYAVGPHGKLYVRRKQAPSDSNDSDQSSIGRASSNLDPTFRTSGNCVLQRAPSTGATEGGLCRSFRFQVQHVILDAHIRQLMFRFQ